QRHLAEGHRIRQRSQRRGRVFHRWLASRAREDDQAGDGRPHPGPGRPSSQKEEVTRLLYAEVAVEAARGQGRETYTYAVPDGVDVVPGHRVTVPFGRRSTYGFVVSLGTDDPGVGVKPIGT